MTIKGHTKAELMLMIRQERLTLTKERIGLMRYMNRLSQIDDRLEKLVNAEYLLENGFS